MKWTRFMGVLISEKARPIRSNRFSRKRGKKKENETVETVPNLTAW